MQNHLTEKDLIEFQFKLVDEQRSAEIARHLEVCSECKRLRDKLTGKFSAFELLRADEKAGEELISKTIEQASKRQVIESRVSFLYRNRWWMSSSSGIRFGFDSGSRFAVRQKASQPK